MVEPALQPLKESDEATPERIRKIIDKHEGALGGLIAILEGVQAQFGFLSEKALGIVAQETGRSLVDIYGVANFYHSFTLKPRGKHLVSVCVGTACHVRGAPAIVSEFKQRIGIEVDETTEDKEFTLKTVNCLGACALGPVAVIDGRYFSKLKKPDVEKLRHDALEGFDEAEGAEDPRIFPVDVGCPFCNHSFMDKDFYINGRPSVRVTVSFGDKHGWFRLSSLYGRYDIFAEYEIPVDTVAHFFCPHCHAELIGSWECAMCSAPMVPMIVRGGGTIRICSRSGCTGSDGHMLDLR